MVFVIVYDFVFAGRSRRKSMNSANSSGSSNRSFSVHHGDGDDDNEVFDLRSSGGRKDYCDMVKTKKITKAALEGGKFSRRLDGMRHNSIPARKHDHCQYCYYQLMNEIPETKRKDYPELKQNRSGVRRCLLCHVNLCPQCDNIFHGADLSAYRCVSM